MGMSFWRFWYLRHFGKDRLYSELSGPVNGEYVVVHDSASMSTRVRRDQLDAYMRYMRSKDQAPRDGRLGIE